MIRLARPVNAICAGQVGRLQLSWLVEPRDLWFGCYWDVCPVECENAVVEIYRGEETVGSRTYRPFANCLVLYFCAFLPFPVKLAWVLR